MEAKLQISFGFCIFLVLVVLLLPVQWWLGAILAAIIHELFHILAVQLCGGEILSVTLTGAEAKIEASPMPPWKQVFGALAGPLGSFLLMSLARFLPEMALCGLIQGAYNLMPIYPLDGGRAINAVFSEPVCRGIELFTLVILTGISLWTAVINPQFGLMLLISAWHPLIRRKNSCKEGNLAVQ